MAQINLTQTGTSGVSTPINGAVAVFSNSADNGALYYKFADGTYAPVSSGGGGGGTSGTSGTSGADGTSGTSGVGGVTTAGTNVTITGIGTIADPYVISSNTSGSGTSGSSGTSVGVSLTTGQVTFADSATTITGEDNLVFDNSDKTLKVKSIDGEPGLIIQNNDTSLSTGQDFGMLTFEGFDNSSYIEGVKLIAEATGSWGVGDTPSRLEVHVNDGSTLQLHTTFNANGLLRVRSLRDSSDDNLIEGGTGPTSNPPRQIVGDGTSGDLKTMVGGRMLMEKDDFGTLDWSGGDTSYAYDTSVKTFAEGSITSVDSSGDFTISISDTITGSFYPGDIFIFGLKPFGVSATIDLKYQYKLNGVTKTGALYDPAGNIVQIDSGDNNANHIIMGQLTYWKRDTNNYGFFPSSHFIKIE